MSRWKHRTVYDHTPKEEHALAASPVKIAYPSPVYDFFTENHPVKVPPTADVPAEYPVEEPAEEPPAAEDVPAEYSLVEELKVDVPTGSKAEDSGGDGIKKPKEQAGEMVLVCTR